MEEIIHHLAVFVSRLWQIHIFGEENTRATKCTCPGKLYEPAKGYPRNNRVFGGILEKLAEVIHKKDWLK